jgi:tetraacyldisaccharide 4'-kinase
MNRETGPRPRFWWDAAPGPLGALLRAALAPCGAAYGAAMRMRARAYAEGRRRVFRPPAPCVSVGNLTVGGSGKTPCVRWIAERLLAAGRRPIVLSRGYGAKIGATGLDEEGASLVRAAPGIAVDQSAGRREGRGDWTDVAADPSVALVLDDGYQKLVCARDVDVLLLDATRPFGNGRCLPAGPLREPPLAAGRADVVVLTRCDQASSSAVAALRAFVAATAPRALLLRSRHAPLRLLRSGALPETLRGRKVGLLSAIAHPAAFEATVRALGATPVLHDARRDHAALGARDLVRAVAAARAAGADRVLCTSKDLPKLEAPETADLPFDALDVALEFLDDPEPLVAALRALPRGAPPR